MKKIVLSSFTIAAVFGLLSCKSSQPLPTAAPGVQQFSKNNTTLMWSPNKADERNTWIRMDSLGKITVLATQLPPLEVQKIVQQDSSLKLKGSVEASQLLKAQSEMARLQNTSSEFLLTNEALYRLAEAYFNGLVDSSKFRELHTKIITQSVDRIDAEIELEEAKAETIFAETEKAKVELQKLQLQFEMLKFEKGVKENPVKPDTLTPEKE